MRLSRRDGGARKSPSRYRSRSKKRLPPRRGKHLLHYDSGKVKGLCRRLVTILAAFLAVPIAPNALYTREDLAMALAYGSCERLFLEGTAARLNALGLAPSADRLVAMLDKVPGAELLESFRRTNAGLLERAKERGLLDGEVVLALDMHRIARYRRPRNKYKGKRKARDLPMAVGGKSVAGTSLAHQFATVEVMGSAPRLTLEVVPWLPGSAYKKVLAELLASAKRLVKPWLLLMDREFFSEEAVGAAMDAGIHFLMPAKKVARVRAAMDRCRGLTHLVEPFDMGARRVNLFVVDRETIGRGKGRWAFITDLPEERWRELSDLYAMRWGIETGYRDKKAFRGRTCSLSYNVRLVLFLVSVLAAGVWTLERQDAPVSWLDETRAHLVRFMVELRAYVWFEPGLLEWALAAWA
jgi:hypothetical protein